MEAVQRDFINNCDTNKTKTGPFSSYLKLINNCDEQAPLLSESPLGQCLGSIELARVPPNHLIQLYQALNVEQLIPTQNGLARDYRGLAELMGFSQVELEARFKRSHNPAKCLIEALATKQNQSHLNSSFTHATLNDLLKLLESLERFDIIDDSLASFIELAEQELEARERRTSRGIGQLSSIETNHDNNMTASGSPSITISPSSQQFNVQARGQQQEARYDAFVCFASEDEDHARGLILFLERHNKRVVTMEHLLPGQFEYDALVQMIATECRKVIIVLTANFLQSRDCEFQTKFANEIAIKSGWFPKIIPVLCEPVDDSQLPPMIRVISKIDMTNDARATTASHSNSRQWQLRKLLGSLDYAPGSLYEPPARQHFEQIRSRTGSVSQRSNFDGETAPPIVELAYSQGTNSAVDLELSNQLSIMTTTASSDDCLDAQSTPNGRTSPLSTSPRDPHYANPTRPVSPVAANQLMNPLNWYRSFKRRVLPPRSPCESIAPSVSSRTKLLHEQDKA